MYASARSKPPSRMSVLRRGGRFSKRPRTLVAAMIGTMVCFVAFVRHYMEATDDSGARGPHAQGLGAGGGGAHFGICDWSSPSAQAPPHTLPKYDAS
jgi:hypothetical protein